MLIGMLLIYARQKKSMRSEMKKKFVMSLRKKNEDTLVGHHIQHIGSVDRETRKIGDKQIGVLVIKVRVT